MPRFARPESRDVKVGHQQTIVDRYVVRGNLVVQFVEVDVGIEDVVVDAHRLERQHRGISLGRREKAEHADIGADVVKDVARAHIVRDPPNCLRFLGKELNGPVIRPPVGAIELDAVNNDRGVDLFTDEMAETQKPPDPDDRPDRRRNPAYRCPAKSDAGVVIRAESIF